MDQSERSETIQARRRRLASVPRAIRCDRSCPCSNSLDPQTAPGRTRRPDQIDSLEKRLNAVERRIVPGRAPSEEPDTVSPQSAEVTPLYQGGPSFTNQSLDARDAARRTAIDSALLQSPAMVSSPERFRLAGGPSGQAPRPLPIDLVLAIIQEIKRNRPIFLCSYAISDPAIVEHFCQKMYFPTTPITSGDIASMYGILYPLLKEFMILKAPLCEKFDLKHYTIQCGQCFKRAIETYDVLITPTFENLLAIIMGFTKAQDEDRPLLSYSLISAAANQCQMMGYQKESTYRTARTVTNSENMRRLFWTTYVIRDVDIDVNYPALSSDPAVRPWDESFVMAIKLASIQGQIYDSLYSSDALRVNHMERTVRIEKLCTDMQQWGVEFKQINARHVNSQKIFEISRDSWDITFYSTFTSLLRASTIGGGEISAQCFNVARLSLQSHIRCFGNYQSTEFLTDSDYANWVLLFSSFTPFIVVFLHAIASSSAADIQLLEDVAESLQRLARVSSSPQRLYQICSLFLQIAKGLVETRTSCIGTYDQQLDSLMLSTDGYPVLFEPESLERLLESDSYPVDDRGGDIDARNLSLILDSWTTGIPSGFELFGGS
ncbi:hypothetical protein BDV25DRAFT_127522 [Aspergillus avenaceus]|uniref:Transcription factor domain-containing protein n=1 Tax=Aspergillus avenaceus TaxID=36643 RepID=A0A5N6U471_ASPAV|nr:hypothetical protein BDV25DRAFT_127522 [Aspergillus avenaceus]